MSAVPPPSRRAHISGTLRRLPLRMILALAWCGLIAAAGTTVATIVSLEGLGISTFNAMVLAPAVLLWVALIRLYYRPPSGMWLAVMALCWYAADAFLLLLINWMLGDLDRPSAPHSFWQMVLWGSLPWVLVGSAALVGWAVRTSPHSRQ